MTETKKPTETPRAGNPFPQMEEEVLNFWDSANIFEKSITKEAPRGDYVFYDGPPFATGEPHYGHIVGSTMKDVVPRYWTMRGYRVERRWGWDCHGLPIENIVEKELGSKHKKDIEALGVDKFNELCRSKVLEYAHIWEGVVRRMGRWADMKKPYRTMDLDFMESVWWTFKQLWDKNLIYESYRSMHICPRCETTLSQSEISEGYKDVKDLSAIAKFELVDEPGTFVLAWTTTPWTLIGNVALAVGANIDYVTIEIKDVATDTSEKYILAKELTDKALKDKNFTIINQIKGSDLVGKSYKPLFNYFSDKKDLENRENGWKIYAGDFVTTEDGTGVVHIAPAFGEDDMNLGKANNLPFVQHVGMDGYFTADVTDENLKGLNVKPADDHTKTDIEIIKHLAHNGLLFHKEKFEHSYPHCWRCDTPLLNYATSSWFVNITKIKERALGLAENINWTPEHIKLGRFGNWLEGARDWSISRQRFWASVMPIWRCECGELKVFGSVAELEKASGQKITDIHKHIVDKITVPCDKCGQDMQRVPDVLDTWFDSGSMPYAQMHYPFENKEKFEANFPAQFIAEGIDQTRCWFYYLHVIATGIKDSHAFNNVIVNGIVLAEDGKKMSKKLKNYPDTSHIFDSYSADAMRYYLMSSPVVAADNLNFSESGVKDVLRNVCMTLWNVYKFFEMFANEKVQRDQPKTKNILDKWIIAKLNKLIYDVTAAMETYDLPRATRPIEQFINELSTWYLRRSRDRFKSDDEDDKQDAIDTMSFVLLQLSKIMAPFTPFIAEQLWQNIMGLKFAEEDRSVHLEDWPEANQIEETIIEEMDIARKIVELGFAKRDEAGIKVRQPLRELKVKSVKLKIDGDYLELIKDEVNVKEITFDNSSEELAVELDTIITEELQLEGNKRDIVRLINAARKGSGFTIQDRITVEWNSESEEVKKTIELFADEICRDTLSEDIKQVNFSIEKTEIKPNKINGQTFDFIISKI